MGLPSLRPGMHACRARRVRVVDTRYISPDISFRRDKELTADHAVQ